MRDGELAWPQLVGELIGGCAVQSGAGSGCEQEMVLRNRAPAFGVRSPNTLSNATQGSYRLERQAACLPVKTAPSWGSWRTARQFRQSPMLNCHSLHFSSSGFVLHLTSNICVSQALCVWAISALHDLGSSESPNPAMLTGCRYKMHPPTEVYRQSQAQFKDVTEAVFVRSHQSISSR